MSMSHQGPWGFLQRLLYPTSTVQYDTGSSRVEYFQEGYCRNCGPVAELENDAAIARALQEEQSQAAEAESYRGVAGPKYVNDYGNEAFCRATHCHHDRGSSYGGNSSMFPEITHEQRLDDEARNRIHQMDHVPVIECLMNRSLSRGTNLHAHTSMSNQDYWRGCHNRQLYPTSTAQHGTGSSRVEYVQESYQRHGGPTVDSENDAAFARARQEKVSQVADTESYTGAAGWGNEACCKASCCLHDYGSSYVSSSSKFWEMTDEPRLDGEVSNMLHHMDRIPHVPKTNSRIPSADEATSDHQRLLERLELYDLYEFKVSGDGNCQFRSLSDQLYGTAEYHKEVRQQVVDQLKANPDLYAPYVPMSYHEYLMKISTLGEWGDHVTLQAAADWYGVTIFVLTSYKDTCYIQILPRQKKSERVIFLSFWAEVHYNSIHHIGASSESDSYIREPDIKKWWKLKK